MSFYDELSKYYDIVFPKGEAQMNFIKKRLSNRKRVLDLACGTGNYSIALAELGCSVTAVDLDESMVHNLNKKAQQQNLDIDAHVMDMKSIDKLNNNKYDMILCIGNSLVHLENMEEIKELIYKLHSLLNEDGVLIIQIVNYDRILKFNIKELPTIDRSEQGVKFIRKYDYKNNKILFNGKLIVNERGEEKIYDNTVQLYPLLSNDLVNIYKDLGMKNIETYGGFNEVEFNEETIGFISAAHS
jgi:glycine/sarcosine N-methyltransferase